MDNANLETDQFILHLTQARNMVNSSSTAEPLVMTGLDMSENDRKCGSEDAVLTTAHDIGYTSARSQTGPELLSRLANVAGTLVGGTEPGDTTGSIRPLPRLTLYFPSPYPIVRS